ncbi:MAG: hypothetical protein AB1942_00520 [Pseudomonadota bacterium]
MIELYPEDTLTHGERLLIRTVRLLALTQPCHGLQGLFEQACGCAGHESYRVLEVFLQQLGAWGRRRLALSVPADLRLTDDETLILDAFGCAQAEDYRSLDERLTSLVGGEPPPALGAAACMVAQALAMNGLLLRVRETPDVMRAAPCRHQHDAWKMAAE